MLISLFLPAKNVTAEPKPDMNVYFIYVGQGDCTLIESQGKYLLIDAGPKDAGPAVKKFLKKMNITHLDYVIATHPHEDHIGGLLTVLNEVTIGHIYVCPMSYTTNTYKNFMNTMWMKNIQRSTPVMGTSFQVGSANVQFISPRGYYYENLNNASIVVRITNGNNSFLMTGDAESLAEQEMLQSNYNLKADVLKVPHHSSKSSSTPEFINAVDPAFSVIECGKNNIFGFPKKATLEKLVYSNVYRTDKQGTIKMHSDGNKISVDKNPSIKAKSKDSTLELPLLNELTVKSNYEGIDLVPINSKSNYSNIDTKPIELKFSAKYGVSKKKSTQYMLVPAGTAFNQKNKWTTGDSVRIQKEFIGSVYVKFSNNVGNSIIMKTTGFCVDGMAPKNLSVVSNGVKVKYEASINDSRQAAVYSNKALTLKFKGDYGASGKGKLEYQLVKNGSAYDNEDWVAGSQTTIPTDFIGRVYVRYTDKAGNQAIRKTAPIVMDIVKPQKCSLRANVNGLSLLTLGRANEYKLQFNKRVIIACDADYGISGKRTNQFMIIKAGTKFNKNKPWKTANSITLEPGFKGCVYVKFTDKAGNETIRKTNGFEIIKTNEVK